jgi:hypothetical protein
MKIVMTRTMRLGNRRVMEGEEIDLPDKFARQFLRVGHATEAGEKKPGKAKPAEKAEATPKDDKKTYKTRRLKAEDND